MEIYPAVDLYEGKVVRLERGDYAKQTVYSEFPEQIAKQWVSQGARWLHVVDLEGARSGEIKNWSALKQILSLKEVSIQFGGGIRQRQDIQRLIDEGVKRVILGSKALDPRFLKEVTGAYPEQIALSLDLRGDEVQIEGWTKGARKSAFDLFQALRDLPLDCLVITDIERDGTLSGVNLKKLKGLLEKAPFPVIFSGGVTSEEDIQSLASLGSKRLRGVIIGKALYENRINLPDALSLVSREEK